MLMLIHLISKLIDCNALIFVSIFPSFSTIIPMSFCSHATFCWTSGGSYRSPEYQPPTDVWGEWVHWCVPFGLRRCPRHQESCPYDKGTASIFSEQVLEISIKVIYGNTLSLRNAIKCLFCQQQMRTLVVTIFISCVYLANALRL